MFENIEKIVRNLGVLRVDEARYGSYIMVCIDIATEITNATDTHDATIFYTGTEIYDAVAMATSPGDINAMDAFLKLESFVKIHPEFLYARGKTLVEALNNLEKRAYLWNHLSNNSCILRAKQSNILLEFISFKDY